MIALFTTLIDLDGNGVAWIGGTQVKVTEVVVERMAHGWSPEEIHFQHPQLSLAQIHAAFTYYYENQTALDREIAEREAEATELARSVSDPGFRARLMDMKARR